MRRDTALFHLVEQIKAARADQRALCIRGGGTKDFYGEKPVGAALETGSLEGITAYEPSELVITVRAGTKLSEVEAALAEQGQCLAFEPPRFGAASTIGGVVCAGLSGPSRAAVGSVRDFVLGATMINGLGHVLSFGGQVMKNVAGYDVSRALAGSMGILGVVAEVSLKVLPAPRVQATLKLEATQREAVDHVQRWVGAALPVHASAWCNGVLMVRLAGAEAAVRAGYQAIGGDWVPDAVSEPFWRGLRDQHDPWFAAAGEQVASGATLWRLSLPATADAIALDGATLIEWGGALRWLVSRAPHASVRHAAATAGGHATLYHAQEKHSGVFTPLGEPLARIHRHLKHAFDPDRIFNPGRLYPEL